MWFLKRAPTMQLLGRGEGIYSGGAPSLDFRHLPKWKRICNRSDHSVEGNKIYYPECQEMYCFKEGKHDEEHVFQTHRGWKWTIVTAVCIVMATVEKWRRRNYSSETGRKQRKRHTQGLLLFIAKQFHQ